MSHNNIIIGFAGYGQVGKDTAANAVTRNFHSFSRIAFADKLKSILYITNPITTNGQSIQELVDQYGWEKAKSYADVRSLIQRLGDALRQEMGPDCLINAALDNNNFKNIVVSDVRFINEADEIVKRGGLVVKITRPGYGPINQHLSEVQLENYSFGLIIDNNSTVKDFEDKVCIEVIKYIVKNPFKFIGRKI